MTGIKTEVAVNENQILGAWTRYHAVSIVVDDAGVTAVSDSTSPFYGKKMVFAGTPLTGDLTATNSVTPFTILGENDTPVGVLLHDVCVDDGDENGTLLVGGVVNINRIRPEAGNVITAGVITALKGKIEFIKR